MGKLSRAEPAIAVVILAAGASGRMGYPKQLLLWEGEPLVQRIARTALSLDFGPVCVVTGAYADSVSGALCGLPVETIFFPRWEDGMGATLGAGVSAVLEAWPKTEAILVLLVDQPFVDRAFLIYLIELFLHSGKPMAASSYAETIGPPAIFSREIFPELITLTGDKGAKKLLLRYPERCVSLLFPAGNFDLDTPEDFKRWLLV